MARSSGCPGGTSTFTAASRARSDGRAGLVATRRQRQRRRLASRRLAERTLYRAKIGAGPLRRYLPLVARRRGIGRGSARSRPGRVLVVAHGGCDEFDGVHGRMKVRDGGAMRRVEGQAGPASETDHAEGLQRRPCCGTSTMREHAHVRHGPLRPASARWRRSSGAHSSTGSRLLAHHPVGRSPARRVTHALLGHALGSSGSGPCRPRTAARRLA